jgi:hypothetical protein
MIVDVTCSNEETLINRQLDLEEESLALGQQRYFERLEQQQDRGEEDATRRARPAA